VDPLGDEVTTILDPLLLRARGRIGSTLRGKWRLDSLLGVGVIYDRQTQIATTHTAVSVANLSPAGAIGWTGAEVALWSGPGTNAPTTAGGRYQPPAPQ
jgi:hypothetical protein